MLLAGIGTALWLSGCVALPREAPTSRTANPKAPAGFPARLAILPVSNQAGEPDGAILIRYFALRKLSRDLGYLVQAPEATDQTIHERTLTGPEIPIQVALARQDAGVLCDWLGADAIVHGELQAWNKAKLSVWQRTQVKVHFWLTDKHGKRLWESGQDSDQSGFGGGGTSVAAILSDGSLPPDVMEKARNSELSGQALSAVDASFSTFPTRY